MDEVRKVARAYYNGVGEDEKNLARIYFRSLDSNGDGKVSWREYKKALGSSSSFNDRDFFEELDADCNKTLDFDEVLALFYLEKVSVPRCRACKSLLLDTYFSCLQCQVDVSYYLCCDCYGRGSFKHGHPSNKFVDTRVLLQLLDKILKQSNQKTDDLVQSDVEASKEDEEDEEEEDEEDEEKDEDEEVEDEEDEEEEEEGDEEDEEEEVGSEEDEEEKDGVEDDEVDKCDNPNVTVNPKERKKTKKNGKAGGKQSSRRHSRKRDKIAKSLDAMDTAVSVGSAAVSVGATTVATTGCRIM